MTAEEQSELIQRYSHHGTVLWIPDAGDLEGHYCSASNLAKLSGLTEKEVVERISEKLVPLEATCREQFNKARATATQLFHETGGGPVADELWGSASWPNNHMIKGKFLLNQIKNCFQKEIPENKIYQIAVGSNFAPDLKQILEQLAYSDR